MRSNEKAAIRGRARVARRFLLSALALTWPAQAMAGTPFQGAGPDAVLGIFGRAGLSVCQRTAEIATYVCRQELNTDNLLAAAVAFNLADEEERREALHDIAVERSDGAAACFEQRVARFELCETLEEELYDPEIDPLDFVHPITDPNPYFPLVPGTTFVYEGETEEGEERVEVTVTDQTREIMGVVCTLVIDQVFVEGQLFEDTRDYFAQDADGNVWYFGEDTLEILPDGSLSVDGSWRAGTDGAKAGIFMLAEPEVEDAYRQEFALGEAEDAAEVLSLDETVEIALGSYTNCLQTAETTPLEPDLLEYKYYAPGVGFVLQIEVETGLRLELVEVIPPSP